MDAAMQHVLSMYQIGGNQGTDVASFPISISAAGTGFLHVSTSISMGGTEDPQYGNWVGIEERRIDTEI